MTEGESTGILRATADFVRLSENYLNSATESEAELFSRLDDYPNLTAEEIIFVIAMRLLSRGHPQIGMTLLRQVKKGDSLVSSYASTVCDFPPE